MEKIVPIVPTVLGNTIPKPKQISPAKHWCFTLNNYSDKDIRSISSNSSIKKYIFQEETGKEGTPHLQGYIEFNEKVRPINMFDNNKIHWEKCRDIKKSIDYCSKEETRTGKIYTNLALKRVDKRLESFVPNIWQKDLLDLLQREPDDRTVIWVYDEKGGKGKSLFAKWLCHKHNDVTCVTMNKSADILTVVEDTCRVFMIDLPRSYDVTYTPFNAIEQIKNGFVTEGKLKKTARQLSFAPPHVVVFSNDVPELKKLSEDRWKIIKL